MVFQVSNSLGPMPDLASQDTLGLFLFCLPVVRNGASPCSRKSQPLEGKKDESYIAQVAHRGNLGTNSACHSQVKWSKVKHNGKPFSTIGKSTTYCKDEGEILDARLQPMETIRKRWPHHPCHNPAGKPCCTRCNPNGKTYR